MQHITGISRHQMRFSILEDTIAPDNQVRFIDAFVEYIDISKLDFAVKTLKTEGRPSFNSKVFLKIYLYGYINGVRSSRDQEKKCFRNIEMKSLL
jgi:transposase